MLIFLSLSQMQAQSPHGESFRVDCAGCHHPGSWDINIDTFNFNHDTTRFALEGTHLFIDCKACHTSLIFDEAPSQCIDCHQEIHSMSVGNDCARCHTTQNWLVDDIPELHEANGFPLIGAHDHLSCVDCHLSESNLRFDRIGNDCINCHLTDYLSTETPNHAAADFSTNCIDCHDPLTGGWNTDIIEHDFFPLTLGHDIQNCTQCHLTTNYSDISPDCVSCHQTDFNNTENPNHQTAGISTDCMSCHTIDPDWMPASFQEHDDLYFPIYSGEHQGEWMECVDCHLTPSDYTEFTCIACHTKPETDHSHEGIGGYLYEDHACLACHPDGDAGMAMDHDTNFFPIYSGSHEGEWMECMDCHTNPGNYADFTCINCHENPETDGEHTGVPGYFYESNACYACHPTGDSDFMFDHDATNFPLTGEHIGVDCIECHADGFEGTSTECANCHTTDYNNAANPNHLALGFPTDCAACHTTEPEWMPASFDIHDNYYALTGEHGAIAHDCAACHDIENYSDVPNTCVACHQADYDAAMSPNHTDLNLPTDCAACHTTDADWTPANFDIHDDYYPLVGAHATIANDCAMCHNVNDYSDVPNTCIGCHQTDYNNATPNHSGFPTDCLQCHNETAWTPSTFNHDDMHFPIYSGKHQGEWGNNCASCHMNANDYSVFSCIDCHEHDDPADLADEHDDVGGYQYNSNACFNCHPDGEE